VVTYRLTLSPKPRLFNSLGPTSALPLQPDYNISLIFSLGSLFSLVRVFVTSRFDSGKFPVQRLTPLKTRTLSLKVPFLPPLPDDILDAPFFPET